MYRSMLGVVCALHASVVFSQTPESDKLESYQQCEHVMAYMALHAGLDFGPNPCQDNEYPASFWFCVDKKVTDDTPFYLAIEHCERAGGLR